MGRPGCRQCCDEEELVTCLVSDSKVDIVYKDSNNQKINVGLTDIRPLIRTSEDIKPENAPEDYDDFVLSESILQEIEDGDYTIVKSDQFPQIIKAYFYNDDKYCFRAFFSTTFPHVKRMEVKTKNREFFYSYKRFDFEGGDSQDYQNIQIKDLDVEIPRRGLTGTGPSGFPDFVLSFSPDILDIAYEGSFGPTSGFCFNVKEELGSYLTEEELEAVEFSIFLDPEKISEETDNLEIVNAGDFNLPISNFGKFSVYNKELTRKDTYMVLKTPSPVDLYYRDHRVVGGDFFYSNIDNGFIDDVNTINKQTVARNSINELLTLFLQERTDWTIVDSGLADAATRTQFQVDFLEDAKEYIETNYESLTYTKMSYIGNNDQDRDEASFKIRKTTETLEYSDLETIIDDIFSDEDFLELMIDKVSDISLEEVSGGILVDFNYRIKQGSSSATMIFDSNLLSSTALPRGGSYTHRGLKVKITATDTEAEYRTFLPRIGESQSYSGVWSKLTGLNGYRENYYISVKYASPTGAFLNGEDSFCVISQNDNLFGTIEVEQERKIGNQMYVAPKCGSIQSRTNVLIPRSYDVNADLGSDKPGGFSITNVNEYEIIYDNYELDLPRAIYDYSSRQSCANRSCGGNPCNTYSIRVNEELVAKNFPYSNSPMVSFPETISHTSFSRPTAYRLMLANYEKTEWKHIENFTEFYKNYETRLWLTGNQINEIDTPNIQGLKDYIESVIDLRKKYEFSSGLATFPRGAIRGSVIYGRPTYSTSSLNYHKFQDETVKTNTYISQWPSKEYYTIDMKPNDQDLKLDLRESESPFLEDVNGNKIKTMSIENRSYLSSGQLILYKLVSATPFSMTSGFYNSGNLYDYSSFSRPFFKQMENVYMGTDIHSIHFTHEHSCGFPSSIIADSYDQYDFTVDSIRDYEITPFHSGLIAIRYESHVSKVKIINNQKVFNLNNNFSVHNEFFDYKTLLEGQGEQYDFSFAPYSGVGDFYDNYKNIYYKLSVGSGIISDSASENISNFYSQYVSLDNTYPYFRKGARLVWEENGYFLDSEVNLGLANRSTPIDTTAPYDTVRSKCAREAYPPYPCFYYKTCVDYDCETCSAQNGLTYNLNKFISDEGARTKGLGYLQKNARSKPIFTNNSSPYYPQDPCPDYILQTEYVAVFPGTGSRIKYTEQNELLLGNGQPIRTASFSGPLTQNLVWDTSCRQSRGFPTFVPSEGVGGYVTCNAPGYHVYRKVVDLGDYYYYDYKLMVADSCILRAYAKHGESVSAGNFSQTDTRMTHIIKNASDVSGISVEDEEQYCEFIREACPNGRLASYFLAQNAISDCDSDETVVAIILDQSVTSYNSAPCRDTWFFVEDQSYTEVDIRSFPQIFTEKIENPYKVTKNQRLGYNGIDEEYIVVDIDMPEVIIDWGE